MGVHRAEEALQFWPLGLVLLGGSMMVQAVRGGADAASRYAVRASFPWAPSSGWWSSGCSFPIRPNGGAPRSEMTIASV